MMTGTVTADREAILGLRVLGPGANHEEVQAVLDTGYNGYLTLPPALIERFALPAFGQRRVTLGDASEVTLAVYEATVLWDDQQRSLQVLASDGDAVIGMALLYGYRVTLDVVDGGSVTIEPLL